ncbi:MAG: hypothetical protein ACYDB7_07960 [Mycobacteriales bacterium]
MTDSPFVIDSLDGFVPDTVFVQGRDQLVLAVRITPTYGQLELSLVAAIVDEANARGMTLLRESLFREEYLLMVFEAYDEDESA